MTTQPTNRGFLANNNFRMVFTRIPHVMYFLQSSGLAGLKVPAARVATQRKSLPMPGDQVQFDSLTVTFIVDEDLVSWLEIHNWMRGIGSPSSPLDRPNYEKSIAGFEPGSTRQTSPIPGYPIHSPNIESVGTLQILNSNNVLKLEAKYIDIWPTELSEIEFETTREDVVYAKARVTFEYSIYDIRRANT